LTGIKAAIKCLLMDCLVFKKGNSEIFRYPISNQTIGIGRGTHNHVILSDDEISRSHLTLSYQDEAILVSNHSSKGSQKNSVIFDKTSFQKGDVLQVGSWLILLDDVKSNQEVTRGASEEKTQIINYEPSKGTLNVTTLDVTVCTAEGKPKNFSFRHFPIKIGTGPHNSLILNDPYISQNHCVIDSRSGQFWIVDAGSKNGTWVHGKNIKEGLLCSSDEIVLGRTNIQIRWAQAAEKIKPHKDLIFEGMIGSSKVMREIFSLIEQVAPSDVPIFISGETGTGKELTARAIYQRSHRVGKPFMSINCGAISPNLIESELFGHEKGAFTGAVNSRRGVFEAAHEGTLFLDEIGELPLELQPKLLRVLEDGKIRRVGANHETAVDVRIITATHRNLFHEVKKERFREDLFYRLYVIPIILPSLKDRQEDLPYLVEAILATHAPSGRKISLTAEALEKLKNHQWPGNIRELKNVLLRSIYTSQDAEITPRRLCFFPTLDSFVEEAKEDETRPHTLEAGERHIILSTLNQCGGNKKKTADTLGIAKSTLFKKLKEYDIL